MTARSQTTIPNGVRKALGIEPGDRLEYVIEGDSAVIRRATRSGDDDQDPALASFLDLLERDIAEHPERLQPMTHQLAERMRRLSAGIEVDLDEEIEGPVAL